MVRAPVRPCPVLRQEPSCHPPAPLTDRDATRCPVAKHYGPEHSIYSIFDPASLLSTLPALVQNRPPTSLEGRPQHEPDPYFSFHFSAKVVPRNSRHPDSYAFSDSKRFLSLQKLFLLVLTLSHRLAVLSRWEFNLGCHASIR